MKFYAVDFENRYDAEYGIEEVGLWHYLNDPRFDTYLVSIYGPGVDYVGHPKDAPWEKINGSGWLAHNSSYDRQVFGRILELGVITTQSRPLVWYCTANLSVSLGGPRNLKDAAKHWLGKSVDKGMRAYMRGRTWEDAVKEGKSEALLEYARQDAINCYELWIKLEGQWSEIERRTAELTFAQTQRGIGINRQLLIDALPGVYAAREAARLLIPWKNEIDEKGEPVPILSTGMLDAWCKKQGITRPPTTNAKDASFHEWQEANPTINVVKAMQTFRSANALFTKGKTLLDRIRDDGRYGFELKYFGAVTGRWSGGYGDDAESAKFNIQNLPKENMFGLDLRAALIPKPGYKFVVADYSQIEPRCLAWLSNDTALLSTLKKGVGLYEAHAIATMGWLGKDLKKANPKMYALAKARCLHEKSLILTKTRGYQQLKHITIDDKLWDGQAWVSHDGLTRKELKPTVHQAGECGTRDHLVYTCRGAEFLGSLSKGATVDQLSRRNVPGTRWHDVGSLGIAVSKLLMETGCSVVALPLQWMRRTQRYLRGQFKRKQIERMCELPKQNRGGCSFNETLGENPYRT